MQVHVLQANGSLNRRRRPQHKNQSVNAQSGQCPTTTLFRKRNATHWFLALTSLFHLWRLTWSFCVPPDVAFFATYAKIHPNSILRGESTGARA